MTASIEAPLKPDLDNAMRDRARRLRNDLDRLAEIDGINHGSPGRATPTKDGRAFRPHAARQRMRTCTDAPATPSKAPRFFRVWRRKITPVGADFLVVELRGLCAGRPARSNRCKSDAMKE